MKKLIYFFSITLFVTIYSMQQSSTATKQSAPDSLEKKIKRLSVLLEQGTPSSILTPKSEAFQRDIKKVDFDLRQLKLDLKSREDGGHNKSVVEYYDILNDFSNVEAVNYKWAESRLYFITLAEAKRIIFERKMEAASLQGAPNIDGHIANFQQARANELATLEFDAKHYKKPKFKDPKKEELRQKEK